MKWSDAILWVIIILCLTVNCQMNKYIEVQKVYCIKQGGD